MFPRNKVNVVLKLAFLASQMTEALIENIWKLHVALFNLCYVFQIVFMKHIKWCIVSHTIVKRNIHQIPLINSCCGPEPGFGDTCGCSGCTYVLAAANSS